MGLLNDLTLPKDETPIEKWLIENRDDIIAELKDYYEGCVDNCGEHDEINTIPAKELYEKANKDILSCKDDIEDYYREVEYWQDYIEKEWDELERQDKAGGHPDE